jgi:CheY-like chemotaxis protein
MFDNFITFTDDAPDQFAAASEWNVLVVDDDLDIHAVTKLCLSQTVIANRHLNLIDAYSARDAIDVLKSNDTIDLILLDVVMETHDAGLEVARWLHEELASKRKPKIILRTGQPGFHQLAEIARNRHVDAVLHKSSTSYATLIDTITTTLLATGSDPVRH